MSGFWKDAWGALRAGWHVAAPQPEPPQNVTIRRADGTVIPCDVYRDPAGDSDGIAHWTAVPRGDITLTVHDQPRIGVLPPRTSIEFVLRFPAG